MASGSCFYELKGSLIELAVLNRDVDGTFIQAGIHAAYRAECSVNEEVGRFPGRGVPG